MVTVITFVARNSDGRGASSTNSSPTSSPYASQARIFLAAAAKGILLKCMSNHAASLPQGALTQGQSESLHRRPRACHGLACPFLCLRLLPSPTHPCSGAGRGGGRHSAAPERPGTLLPWGLGIAVPSAGNLFSSDVCLLCLFLLLPVFAQMPSCRRGLLGHLVFTFYLCFLFDIYLFMCLCMAALSLRCNMRSLSLQVHRLFFGESRFLSGICVWD